MTDIEKSQTERFCETNFYMELDRRSSNKGGDRKKTEMPTDGRKTSRPVLQGHLGEMILKTELDSYLIGS